MSKKVKQVLMQVTLCVGLIVLIWGGYFFMMEVIDRQITPCRDNFFWSYQLDSVSIESEKLILTGFAFPVEGEFTNSEYEIVLRDETKGKNLFLKTEYIQRLDVKEYFNLAGDCSDVGFKASVRLQKVDLKEKEYEVLLRIKGEKTAYRTGVYIINEKMTFEASDSLDVLEVVGTDIEEIVENGKRRVYRPEEGVYVYQYEDALYWIVDDKNMIDEDGDKYMHFQIQLVKEDGEDVGEWIDRSFWFSKNELLECNTGKYRVAKIDVLDKCKVETFRTGEKDTEWMWLQYFRPWYYWSAEKSTE